MLISLPFADYRSELKLKRDQDKRWIFDPIREKWLVLLPEEFVRQLIILYFLREKGYNSNRIAVERGLTYNNLSKRCDLLVFAPDLKPFLLVECKAPSVPITQDAFRQIAIYNMQLNVPFLMVSNGMDTYCCAIDHEERTYHYLSDLPEYPTEIGF